MDVHGGRAVIHGTETLAGSPLTMAGAVRIGVARGPDLTADHGHLQFGPAASPGTGQSAGARPSVRRCRRPPGYLCRGDARDGWPLPEVARRGRVGRPAVRGRPDSPIVRPRERGTAGSTGDRPQLAGSVAGFVTAVLQGQVLEQLLMRISHKHAPLGLRPGQYQVVPDRRCRHGCPSAAAAGLPRPHGRCVAASLRRCATARALGPVSVSSPPAPTQAAWPGRPAGCPGCGRRRTGATGSRPGR